MNIVPPGQNYHKRYFSDEASKGKTRIIISAKDDKCQILYTLSSIGIIR